MRTYSKEVLDRQSILAYLAVIATHRRLQPSLEGIEPT